MTESLEAYLRDPGLQADGHYTGLLRQALGEVLKLSSTVVDPLEAQIESEYGQAKQDAQARFTRDKDKTEREFRLRRQEIRQQYEVKAKEAEADYETRLSALKVDIQQRRKRVMQAAVEMETAAEKERQDQMLVIDFVAEGAATKRQQRSFEAKANAEEGRRRLDELDAEATRLIEQYRCSNLASTEQLGPAVDGSQTFAEACRTQEAQARRQLERLRGLFCAQMFVGIRPALFAGGLLGGAVAVLAILHLLNIPGMPPGRVTVPIVLAALGVLIALGGRLLWQRSRSQVRRVYGEFRSDLAGARMALGQQLALALDQVEQEWQAAVEQKQAEIKRAQTALETAKANIGKQRGISLRQVEDQRQESLNGLKGERDRIVRAAKQKYEQQQSELESRFREDMAAIQRQYDEEMAASEGRYQAARKSLEQRWDTGLARIDTLFQNMAQLDRRAAGDWDHLLGESWTPSQTPPSGARFAAIETDLGCLAGSVVARAGTTLKSTKLAALSVMLEFPDHCSLLLEYPREGRQQAIDTLRAVMMRLFASFPPGQARFTILDPVGLGESFAGFMHAGDYLESLVGGRIWTEAPQIQEQLEELTQHMENVIQKYLRNEF